MSRRSVILLGVSAVAVVVLFALDLWLGPVRLSFAEVWNALFGFGGVADSAAGGGAGADVVTGTGAGTGIGADVVTGTGAVTGIGADVVAGTGAGTGFEAVTGADRTALGIVRSFRLPKALTAVLAGAALGASGLQMQTIFRNPLAGPYVLGISSGASLGVALFLLGAPLMGVLPGMDVVRSLGITGSAWLGAGLIFMLIVAVSRRIKDIMVILILGMMLGSVAGAVVEVLQYFSSEGAVKSFVVWTMGSLGSVTAGQLRIVAPVVAAALAMSVVAIKPLNAMMLGEQYARTMGVNVGAARRLVFVNTTLLAGTVTAFCGPIGFLGLAVPHIARILSGEADHRVLMPATMIIGAAVMLGCDIVSQLPGRTPLPINTITALVGIPVIILVLVRNKKFF